MSSAIKFQSLILAEEIHVLCNILLSPRVPYIDGCGIWAILYIFVITILSLKKVHGCYEKNFTGCYETVHVKNQFDRDHLYQYFHNRFS